MRMLTLAALFVSVLICGCNQPVETVPTTEPAPASDGSSGTSTTMVEPTEENGESAIRFVADKKFSVPNMECPYACWPKVKDTLAGQPGVEGVQLAEQPEGTPEGEIATKVVELKLGDEFDADAAIAALKQVNFDAEVLN